MIIVSILQKISPEKTYRIALTYSKCCRTLQQLLGLAAISQKMLLLLQIKSDE